MFLSVLRRFALSCPSPRRVKFVPLAFGSNGAFSYSPLYGEAFHPTPVVSIPKYFSFKVRFPVIFLFRCMRQAFNALPRFPVHGNVLRPTGEVILTIRQVPEFTSVGLFPTFRAART